MLSELTLLVLSVLNDRLDYIAVAFQILRVCNFMFLLGVYLGLSYKCGPEYRPLLETQGSVGSDTENDLERNMPWSVRIRNDSKRVKRRLKRSENLGKYLKGFAVSSPHLDSAFQNLNYLDFLSLPLAKPQRPFANAIRPCSFLPFRCKPYRFFLATSSWSNS